MTLFIGSLLLMLSSSVLAWVLAYRLKLRDPDLYRTLHIAFWLRAPQFWVYRFAAPSNRRELSRSERTLAIASMLLLSTSLVTLVACILGFAVHGNH